MRHLYTTILLASAGLGTVVLELQAHGTLLLDVAKGGDGGIIGILGG